MHLPTVSGVPVNRVKGGATGRPTDSWLVANLPCAGGAGRSFCQVQPGRAVPRSQTFYAPTLTREETHQIVSPNRKEGLQQK